MEIIARGVGRRKEAVAQVQIVKGTGLFIINHIPAQQYLHNNTCSLLSIKAPLNALSALSGNSDNNVTENLLTVNVFENMDTIVKVKGGGLVGQAEAIRLGLARACCSLTTEATTIVPEEIRKQLKDKGYLTQDSRVKERRKYGLKKARKATQYNKR